MPAKGFDDGRRVKNSRNETEYEVIGSSGIAKKSSKMPDGGSGAS